MTIPLTPQDAARLVEFTEAEAYVDLFRAAPVHLGFQTLSVQSASVLVSPGLDIPLFNRVLGLGLLEPATEQSIDLILDQFHQHRVRNFFFQISLSSQPPALAAWLEARQLTPRDNWAKVYRPAHPPVTTPTDLRIGRISIEHAEEFARVGCTAFEMPDMLRPWLEAAVGRPGWHHFLAWDAALPVACAALYVTTHRVGWLGVAATLPSHRRRGAQGALMAQRIHLGAALGCEWLVTETGEDTPQHRFERQHPNPSYHNMLRTGFQLPYQRPNYFQQQSNQAL